MALVTGKAIAMSGVCTLTHGRSISRQRAGPQPSDGALISRTEGRAVLALDHRPAANEQVSDVVCVDKG